MSLFVDEPVFARVVNLTGVPLAIVMSPGCVARVPVDAASPPVGAACLEPAQLYLRIGVGALGERVETSAQPIYTYDGALKRDAFIAPEFIERARDALVVVRPEHFQTLKAHLMGTSSNVVCARASTGIMMFDGVVYTLVDGGFIARPE